MDYKQLFDRWVALTILSEDERRNLMSTLHHEITGGAEVLAALAASEVGNVLDEAIYQERAAYLDTLAPILALAVLDGYLIFLMEQGMSPETAGLAASETTDGLAEYWSKKYKLDQNISYLDKADPVINLILTKLSDLRMNQSLALYPAIVDLPYKVVEKVHQYIGWAVSQGYVLGIMEQELRTQSQTLRG